MSGARGKSPIAAEVLLTRRRNLLLRSSTRRNSSRRSFRVELARGHMYAHSLARIPIFRVSERTNERASSRHGRREAGGSVGRRKRGGRGEQPGKKAGERVHGRGRRSGGERKVSFRSRRSFARSLVRWHAGERRREAESLGAAERTSSSVGCAVPSRRGGLSRARFTRAASHRVPREGARSPVVCHAARTTTTVRKSTSVANPQRRKSTFDRSLSKWPRAEISSPRLLSRLATPPRHRGSPVSSRR